MKLLTASLTAAGLALSLGLVPATDAGAKAHDSGVSENGSPPGQGGRSGEVPGAGTSTAAQGALGKANQGAVGATVSSTGEGGARDASSEPGFSDGKGNVSGGASGGNSAASGD